jgi:hypothetical protein
VRVLAIDWSGDAHLAHKRLWLAEANDDGRLVRLEAGRSRRELGDHLLAVTSEAAIGLDFGFSFPNWYLDQLALRSAPDLWAYVAEHGEAWLAACEPPFWGRRGHARPVSDRPAWRRTEVTAPRHGGIRPKSMFQIGGAGAVGTGSLRGMPLLHRLHAAGATIWPFTSGSWPLVVEIYPRLLTGPVNKSNTAAREVFLAQHYPLMDPAHSCLAVQSEDAFDAAVSALVMAEHAADLQALRLEPEPDLGLRLEGRIWHPAWRSDSP